MGCIYLVRNKVNGKGYVGQTVGNLPKRRREHLCEAGRGSKCPIHAAIRKYGKESFSWKTIMECDDEDDLNESEIVSIKALRTLAPDGYNLEEGGNNARTSEETKQKMREAKLGWKPTVKSKEKNRQAHLGRKLSEEHKRKISEALKGSQKHKESCQGRKLSEEHKRKISEGHKKSTLSRENIRRVSESNRGRKRSLKTRKKMRIAQLRRCIQELEDQILTESCKEES